MGEIKERKMKKNEQGKKGEDKERKSGNRTRSIHLPYSQPISLRSIVLLTNSLLTEPKGSTPLTPKPATRRPVKTMNIKKLGQKRGPKHIVANIQYNVHIWCHYMNTCGNGTITDHI
jgi:hypothetical protein